MWMGGPCSEKELCLHHMQNALDLLEKPSLKLTASLQLNIDGWKITFLLG